ncbi:phage terminase large subunit [Xenorhabdus sp. BG5]|uniref:phage terminase large subunit n=1 Tax=Xenorhabdus sp. BG5 TaxID=2782014 RepID=UPI00187E2FE3|nr:phage terminase large subunit [Xenorhabdus sp. BG5]MBE8596845.1 phage terminase large subunit [Xenorhabdus sp. BG5]
MDIDNAMLDEAIEREIARRSLHEFIQYINPEYITSDFSRQVCAALDEFLLDMMAGKRPILILGAPPQHGKSDIVSRYLPAYFFGKYPDKRVAGLSYGKDLASDMNRDVQRIMMSEEYRNLFPASSLNPKRVVTVEIMAKRNSETFEIVGNKGSYIAAGVGGPLTGKKVDLGIIDDPIKNSQEALSPTTKNAIWNWYVSTFKTRLSKNSGEIIMATRWATDDLSGKVIEKTPKAKVLAFPAINEQGEALVPELHPIEKLLETKGILGDYFWSAMYQQSPKPGDGQIFHEEFVRYYLPKDLPTKFDRVIHSWDMTFKDSDGTDFVVGQVWGKKDANAYLLYQIRKRMSFTKTKEAVKLLAEKFPEGRRKLVEDKANGPAVIDSLKSTVSGLVPVEPDGSKIARAHACTAEWEAGNVWLPHKDIAPWVVETVEEITTFPFAGHDDTVDAMTQALRDLYQKRRGISMNPDIVNQAMRHSRTIRR